MDRVRVSGESRFLKENPIITDKYSKRKQKSKLVKRES